MYELFDGLHYGCWCHWGFYGYWYSLRSEEKDDDDLAEDRSDEDRLDDDHDEGLVDDLDDDRFHDDELDDRGSFIIVWMIWKRY